ncbi:MAG: hypothetical protein H0T92_13545 [Pyrinomonadaceae bacterium]|nr:hypothetical protein [Pyrinomonadaceae bacterium]
MSPFGYLKWPEMRPVALELIARMNEGHGRNLFSIPVADFVGVFAPDAPAAEMEKVVRRGDIHFTADSPSSGTFALTEGEMATFDLGRDGLVLRVPSRMSGRYEVRPDAFHIEFNKSESLEGCKRILLLICNPVISINVSSERVDIRLPNKIFDLCVEF